MNIFATYPDPVKCAVELDNKRVVKMVLETCQLLSTAIHITGGMAPYKPTHVNHPCSIWVRDTRSNYEWTLEHFEALLKEYTLRYGKTHKCQQYRADLVLGRYLIPNGPMTTHPNCTTFKDVADVHKAYRLYMREKWNNDKAKPKWTYQEAV